MDWLTLLFLVPLVIIPIVFLGGFAGCGFSAGQDPCPTPSDPTELTASAAGGNRIALFWKDNGTNTAFFDIRRSEDGADPILLARRPAAAGTPPILNEFTDTQELQEGKSYEYQVFAVLEPTTVCPEAVSNALTIGPLGWKTAFGPVTFDANQVNWANDCMVQRINAAGNLLASGNAVRITLRSSSENVALIIERAYISRAAHPEGSEVDLLVDSPPGIASDLTQVTFGGNEGIFLPAGGSETSDEKSYGLDHTRDLIIAFDIGIQGGTRRGPKVGCQAYRGQNTDQAAIEDRSNFTVQGQPANTVYLIEKIEVLFFGA